LTLLRLLISVTVCSGEATPPRANFKGMNNNNVKGNNKTNIKSSGLERPLHTDRARYTQ
jgi:hypothetical protein